MADDNSIIDVLIVIDEETILTDYGTNNTPDTPTQITKPNLIFMVTKQANVISGEAGTELKLSAKSLDVIRWREATLSLNSANTAILYKFVAASGGDLISQPVPLLADVTDPLPNPSDPTHPGSQTIKSYFWNSTVLSAGNVTYHFQFMIVDREGNIQGYYWWDPFITITD